MPEMRSVSLIRETSIKAVKKQVMLPEKLGTLKDMSGDGD